MAGASNETINNPISVVGTVATTINVTFSPQFLALLSEHLYSSPNKAFEELLSNSWDAQATSVYVRIPSDLTRLNSAIWILDNGISMDVSGFEQLWSIATSTKRNETALKNRKPIGKFGIGKLATYVLCNELTYICKASDGIIRIITMDYRSIDEAKTKHMDALPLTVREIKTQTELQAALNTYDFGTDVLKLIDADIPPIKSEEYQNEFGGMEDVVTESKNTWTLAILTSLKDGGKGIHEGWIKHLLRTALPLGSSISIDVNGEYIKPSKSDKPTQKLWVIGPDLEFDNIELEDGSIIKIEKNAAPYPHIKIDGVGEITGKTALYQQNIKGGKSDKISESYGFFINVLGRVINPEDNLFRMTDLNLSVLALFRATVRVDGLDKQLSANREAIAESNELKIVRAFLKKLFNLARREFNKLEDKKFNDAGKGKKDDLSNVPIAPLTNLLNRVLQNQEELPAFVGVQNQADFIAEKEAWLEATKEDLSKTLTDVDFKEGNPEEFHVKYDLKTRKIVINKNHPFVKENTHTSEQINTMRDTATVDLLTDAYILNSGITNDVYYDIMQHRDRAMRLIAQIRRNSASQIITTLSNWTSDAKPFEEIVGDAFEFIGFAVERYGDSGEPEGVATAFITPKTDDEKNVYSFTYDAKSTKHNKAQTGNLNIAGLARHRTEYKADYSMVIAPDFQKGALEKEAESNKITPMRANTLARLVSITVGFGPINLIRLKELFLIYSPDKVDEWVSALEKEMQEKSFIDLKIFVSALDKLVTPNRIDILGCDAIAQKYREITGVDGKPSRTEIAQLCRGLSLVIPNAIFIDPNKGFDVFLMTHPSMLVKEIQRQTENIPANFKIGILNE